ncbi:T9SS type A sorting domain-containing protein [Flavicella sediminum]|uniref:T9SS type A sorting domain-containing protein n=1 Tax=Flavicella sediminum TaxID=2585141 RepID=UPI0011217852|nr:T9SS type A sorting domain-containing protein [Flavicella sediminum]
MKTKLLLLIILCSSLSLYANTVYRVKEKMKPFDETIAIPNANFEQALIDLGYDTNGLNGNILKSEAEAIVNLNISRKEISDLTGLSNFIALENLNISYNDLSSLDLSNNKKLLVVECNNNKLTVLDVSDLLNLQKLYCYNNQLAYLDVSKNIALSSLSCGTNPLENLNVKNGNNKNFSFYSSFMASPSCIKVDDAQWSEANWSKSGNSNFSEHCSDGGNTYVPDDNLEQALIDLGYDSGGELDNFVPTEEIVNITSLDLSNKNIKSLQGLKSFTALKNLNCSNNLLDYDTNYTIAQHIPTTQLESLDVSFNLLTKSFKAEYFTSLKTLNCSNNQIETIILRGTNNLEVFKCNNNKISFITLDEKGVFESLVSFDGSYNLLEGFHVAFPSENFSELRCTSSLLQSIDIKNGNNQNLNIFEITENPNLICVQVDDYEWSTSNWVKDDTTDFSEDCTLGSVSTDFEAYLIEKGYDKIADNKLLISKVNELTYFEVLQSNLTSLIGASGLKYFTGLNKLVVLGNPNLVTLDTKELIGLKTLDCSENPKLVALTLPDFSTNLVSLNCYANKLNSLNVFRYSNLYELQCQKNYISNLDVSNNRKLGILACNNNNLSTLDIANNGLLKSIYCYANNIESLHLNNKTQLETLHCSSNPLGNLDLSTNINLFQLYAEGLQMTSIDLNKNTKLGILSVGYNELLELDVTNNLSLRELDCSNNKIEDLDLSKNALLTSLNCSSNLLKSLNAKNGNNHNIIFEDGYNSNGYLFETRGNMDLRCVQVDNAAFSSEKFTFVDANTAFNEDCNYPTYTYVPDTNFEQVLINQGYDDVLDDYVLTENIRTVTNLTISANTISDLTGIENFEALSLLDCADNQISSLDVSANKNLKYLICYNNNLSNLILSESLESVFCNKNKISNLNTSSLKELKELKCQDNLLESIDLTTNLKLETLECGNNPLTILDVSANLALESLFGYNTNIESLDLTNNGNLAKLVVPENKNLSMLKVNNGNNLNFTQFLITQNPNLSCVQVDNVTYANTSLTNKDSQTTYSLNCTATILMPDSNFEQALIDLGYDSNGLNGNILKSDAEAVIDLNVSSKNISDLTGIEGFTALKVLYVLGNNLTSLDVSKNRELVDLRCHSNNLTSLDISNNLKLNYLNASGNSLTNLDVSTNELLKFIYVFNNKLTSLDVSSTRNLERLQVYQNDLTSINLSGLISLEQLHVHDNELTSIDISSTINLEELHASQNVLSSLDVSSNTQLTVINIFNNSLSNLNLNENVGLKNLSVAGNNLTSLDVSANIVLEELNIQNNSLSSLDVSLNTNLEFLALANNNSLTKLNVANGNNSNFTLFSATGNPNLTCVEVDDVAYATTNWTNVDDAAVFSTDCYNPAVIEIPDANFEQALINHGYDTNGLNGNILKSEAEAVVYINSNKNENTPESEKIIDLTGIEGFINLNQLILEYNSLATVDFSNNSKLTSITINNNQLTTINVSENSKLTSLIVSNNLLTTIDVSKNQKLFTIWADNNQISTINLSNNLELEQLGLSGNNFSEIDFSKNLRLKRFDMSNNKLVNLDVRNNPDLTLVWISDNQLKSLDFSGHTKLERLKAANNNLGSLNIKNGNNTIVSEFELQNNPNLTCVEVDDVNYAITNWTNIDDAKVYNTDCSFPDLVYIPDANLKAALLADSQINTNGDDEIQVSEAEAVTGFLTGNDLGISDLTGVEAFVNITGLSINNNNLTSIDLSKNTKLTFLACANNNLKSLDVTNNTLLETLGCYDNQIKYLDLSNSKTLYNFSAQRNELEYLNIRNGNNNRMSDFYVKDNPNLECIQVDDETWSTTYWGSTKDASASFSNDCGGVWEVYTEDEGLETALVSLAVLDENSDGKITYEEAQAFVGDLDLSGKNITDITGLAAFSNAASINISGNSITDINKLLNSKSVTVTAKSTGKKQYRVRDSSNGIKKLNVSNNLIKEIDISQVTSITELLAANNRLVYVNLNNGVNESLLNLDVTGNSELSCIQVDNVANASSNINWKKDVAASYNTNCQKGPLSVTNLLKEHLQIYPNPVSQNFTIKLTAGLVFEKAEVYSLVGAKVASSELETVDVGQLPSGIYIVKIKTDQGLIVSKISKR